jgi:hypothetical protein
MNDKTTLPAVKAGFQVQVNDFEQAWRLADMISQSSLCPKAYAGRPGDCMTAMLMGAEIGLNPIQSLQNIATINGKPSLYGDACLALVMRHPQFTGIDETINADETAATCVLRRGDATVSRTFTKSAAENAGLWGKPGPWQNYKPRMLQMRARSWAIRDLYPDALLGLAVAEEMHDAPYIDNGAAGAGNSQVAAVLGKVSATTQETEKTPHIANAEASEGAEIAPESENQMDFAEPAPEKNEKAPPTYAEIRARIEKSASVDELIGISKEAAGLHHLGKKMQTELKDAVNARHKAIVDSK